MDKKNRTEAYRFLTTDRQEKINTGNPTAGERRRLGWGGGGVRQLRSNVNTNTNTNTNLREENRTVHRSRKRVIHIMNKKQRGHSYTFSQKGEPILIGDQPGYTRDYLKYNSPPENSKIILILYSNKNMK